MIPLYQQKYASEFDPLMQTFNELRGELVRLFDNVYAEKAFSKSDKAKIKDIICAIAMEVIVKNDDEDLKRIYNRHSGSDFDAEAEEEKGAMKAMMEDISGVDLGDDIDFRSPESMMAHVGEKMLQKLEQEEQVRQEHKARGEKRKKSATALSKEAQQQAEAQNISQSIRDGLPKISQRFASRQRTRRFGARP
jgi:hypothetical protein